MATEATKTIKLDPVGGVSGDMFVAALLGLRPDLWAACRTNAEKVLPSAILEWTEHSDGVLTGHRFVCRPPGHETDPHSHTHWSEIRKLLSGAGLPLGVQETSLGVFSRLAEAEAAVHGIDPDKVAFHEVGAWDSIIDIVCAATLIDGMGPCEWVVGDLPLGRGTVKSQHGALPLPAPAVNKLLQGYSFVDDGEEGERVTPTGAAILVHLNARQNRPGILGQLKGEGTGFGTRKFHGRSNILRATAYQTIVNQSGYQWEAVTEIRFEIDDQTPEDLAIGLEHLRETDGVLDICHWPTAGKKGRMASAIQILCMPERAADVTAAAFRETTTLGIRQQTIRRAVLGRHDQTVEGTRVKVADRPGGHTAKTEADEVAKKTGFRAREILRRETETKALGDGEDDV